MDHTSQRRPHTRPDIQSPMLALAMANSRSEGDKGDTTRTRTRDGKQPQTERTRHLLPPELGAELRAARERQALSYRGAGALAGIEGSYLCQLEQAKRCPSRVVAEALISALGLDASLAARLLEASVTDAGRSFVPPGR